MGPMTLPTELPGKLWKGCFLISGRAALITVMASSNGHVAMPWPFPIHVCTDLSPCAR